MEIDRDKVRTQEEEAEPAPIDQVEERVEAEIKEIEDRAKESVAEGLQGGRPGRAAHESENEVKRESGEAQQE